MPPRRRHENREETLEERIDYLIEMTGGRMPIGMVVRDAAELAEARSILASKKGRGAKLIQPKLLEDLNRTKTPARKGED